VLVTEVPGASVTKAVVVSIRVSRFIGNYVVRAGSLVPVIGSIVFPSGAVGVSVIVVPKARLNVADTVVVLILVSTFNLFTTKVALKVVVIVNVIFAVKSFSAKVALKVLVGILVYVTGAGKLGLALVTFEVVVSVLVDGALHSGLTVIAFQVVVCIRVSGAGHGSAAGITQQVSVEVGMYGTLGSAHSTTDEKGGDCNKN
jgi:hypothetical protein